MSIRVQTLIWLSNFCFLMSACDNDNNGVADLPQVTTNEVTEVSFTSATARGNVTSDGGAKITECGICYSTEPGPTIESVRKTRPPGTGPFTVFLADLSEATTYYLRTYATNSAGTSYGEEVSFTMLGELPTINTGTFDIALRTATLSGNVTDDGGLEITSRGICYGMLPSPTVDDSVVTEGNGTGIFTGTISNIQAKTTYYARPYATNKLGTAYGSEITFTIPLGIGTNHEGGIVAYILQPGDLGYQSDTPHGLITATDYPLKLLVWGCEGRDVSGMLETAIGTGQQNTLNFLQVQAGCVRNTELAAVACAELSINGYSDWYLPSKDELNQIYINRALIGVSQGRYWTSSVNSFDPYGAAFTQFFPSGEQYAIPFEGSAYVKPVRSF